MPENVGGVMKKETLAALIASAEKWEANALAKVPEEAHIHADSCPLCAIFDPDETEGRDDFRCHGCPVREKTRLAGCRNTPWLAAFQSFKVWHEDGGDAFRAAAKREAEFLRDLVP